MQGMIFAAGLGTRLQPKTLTTPKALIEVNGRTLLETVVDRMITSGIKQITINVHHFAQDIIDYIDSKKFNCKILISDEREELLDTGGGLKKAWQNGLLDKDEDILVHNVDIISSIDFEKLHTYHRTHKNLVTLEVKERETSRYLLFDENKILCGRELANSQKVFSRKYQKLYKYAFNGVHIVNPQILDDIALEGKFSIVDAYMDLSKKYNINYHLERKDVLWYDVGTIEKLETVDKILRSSSINN
ncbi:MAG: sugar phosphate nucleotidyltransferase [Bacteroidota bacterium]|nr:sugar phosphate nucleotidyltransferase [Bacteroidota bacterium]